MVNNLSTCNCDLLPLLYRESARLELHRREETDVGPSKRAFAKEAIFFSGVGEGGGGRGLVHPISDLQFKGINR